MIHNGRQTDALSAVKATIEERKERDNILTKEKERLKHTIIINWEQTTSLGFWKKCFKVVPFDVIQKTYKHIILLKKTGYPVHNEAGLFVSILKKLGHVPLKEVVVNGKQIN